MSRYLIFLSATETNYQPKPGSQTGLNSYMPANPVTDLSGATDDKSDASMQADSGSSGGGGGAAALPATANDATGFNTATDLILQRDQEQGVVSLGFVMDPQFDDRDHFYHHSTRNHISSFTVNSSHTPLSSGEEIAVKSTNPVYLNTLYNLREDGGMAQPLTDNTHYTVTITGTETTISAYITDNITGTTQPLGSIYKRYLQDGAPQPEISLWNRVTGIFSSDPQYYVSYAENPVMQEFTKKIADKIRDVVGNK